jgi:Tol biopolymer transport system component
MRYIYILILVIGGNTISFGQNKEAYKKNFAMANGFLAKKNYAQALHYFSEARKIDSSSANIDYKVGICYMGMPGIRVMAVPYLLKAIKNVVVQYDPNSELQISAPPAAYYYLGTAYQEAFGLAEAVNNFKTFETYIRPSNKDSLALVDHHILQCNNAKMFVMAPSNALVIDFGDSINSGYDDYSPLVSPDESYMMFTSRRPGGVSKEVLPDGSYHSYIYITYRKNDTSWTTPKLFDPNFNAMADNVCSSISADAQTMLLWCSDNRGNFVYQTQYEDNNWGTMQDPGGDINMPSTATNACVSPDGNILYFVSEREGGFGGKDIWRCVKLPNGKWSLAVNLGKAINTPFNEETPYMHSDAKTFFFSSEGHNSIGGYDIFFARSLDSGKWTEPFNMGYPINSPSNEMNFALSPDGKHGYYNSDRPDGHGGQDIYMVNMPHAAENPLTVIKGQIHSADGSPLPDDIRIIATDNNTGQQAGEFKPVKMTGTYTIIVPPGKSYTLSYQYRGREFYTETIEVPSDAGYKEIHKALTLSPTTWKITNIDTTSGKHKPDGNKDKKSAKHSPNAPESSFLLNRKNSCIQYTAINESYFFVENNISCESMYCKTEYLSKQKDCLDHCGLKMAYS